MWETGYSVVSHIGGDPLPSKITDSWVACGRYFGIDSETGHRWFNFDPLNILECGLTGMEANGFNEDLQSWVFLGEIIEMGRVYE